LVNCDGFSDLLPERVSSMLVLLSGTTFFLLLSSLRSSSSESFLLLYSLFLCLSFYSSPSLYLYRCYLYRYFSCLSRSYSRFYLYCSYRRFLSFSELFHSLYESFRPVIFWFPLLKSIESSLYFLFRSYSLSFRPVMFWFPLLKSIESSLYFLFRSYSLSGRLRSVGVGRSLESNPDFYSFCWSFTKSLNLSVSSSSKIFSKFLTVM
jgi:hypothetical protein